MDKQIREYSKRNNKKRILKRVVSLLCVVVLLFTMNTLKRNANTLERIPMCGLIEHIHGSECFNDAGELVCGMLEHVHTDACYQQSPTAGGTLDDLEINIDGYDNRGDQSDAGDAQSLDLSLDLSQGDLLDFVQDPRNQAPSNNDQQAGNVGLNEDQAPVMANNAASDGQEAVVEFEDDIPSDAQQGADTTGEEEKQPVETEQEQPADIDNIKGETEKTAETETEEEQEQSVETETETEGGQEQPVETEEDEIEAPAEDETEEAQEQPVETETETEGEQEQPVETEEDETEAPAEDEIEEAQEQPVETEEDEAQPVEIEIEEEQPVETEGETEETASTEEAPQAEPESQVARPAQHFEEGTAYMNVIVDAPEGAFPEGTVMVVKDVQDEGTLRNIEQSVAGDFVEVTSVHAVDISFWYNDTEIEPLLPIAVVMSAVEADAQSETPVVVHVADNGETSVVDSKSIGATEAALEMPATENPEAQAFEADSFSVYAIVGTQALVKNYIDDSGKTWRIKVGYTESAGLPEGARLEVAEIKDSESYMAEAEAALEEGKRITKARFFDIRIMDTDGNEVQPREAVQVTVTMLGNEGELEADAKQTDVGAPEVLAMHFVERNDEIVKVVSKNATESGDSVTFTAEGFSPWGVVYTVDFHFVGGDFSIVGGSGVYFSVIANELNLYGKVEGFAMEKIDDMAFSNPQLVSVERVVDDNGAVNWLLRSLQPFNTEETLTLHMIDNSVLVIDVTDDQTGLASFITDARIVIDGTTYGPGDTWPAYEDVDYNLTLSFSERGSRQFPKGGESISMDLPYGMTIPEGTNGTFTIEAGLAGNVTGNSYRVEGGKLIITFGSDPSDILTRSSNVHFDLNFVCQITENVQKITFTDGVEGNIDLRDGADVTVNKTGSYNETTGQMDYTVTLSSKGNSSNVHVNDVISGNKLTLDQSSIVINPSKELVGGIIKSDTGFDLTIKELANGETVTIKYSANIDMSGIGPDFKIIDAATNGKNSVNVENADGHRDNTDFTYTNEIKYSNIRKVNSTVEDGTGADADKKILTWKIVANDNYRGSIVGGKISDTIEYNCGPAMKYVDNGSGQVALDITAKRQDGTVAYHWTDTTAINSVNGEQQGWTYTIPQKGSADEVLSYEITYKTIVDPSKVPAYNNGTVKNDTTNDHGGSTSGTGFVGGGGDEPGDETTITATKTAKTVTSDYIDWDIVVVIPAEGYDTFEIVDDLPLSNGQPNGADMPYGDPVVSGLVDGESYKTEIIELVGQDAQWIKRDGENLTAYRMKLTFYKDQDKTVTGLKETSSQRLLTVTIRTKNDPVWLEQGNGQVHTNNAKINGYQVSATAKPVRSTVTKKVSSADAINGMPAYFYQIVLTNVTSDTVELDDYFDGNHLAFGDSNLLVDGGGSYNENSQYILYWGENDYDQNRDMGSGTYNLPKFTTPEAGHLHIKVENIPKTAQGAYYPYYIVRYVLKVKDAQALNDIKEKAIRNKGKYEIANSAFWGTTGDDVTIDYEVSGLDKDGWFRNSIDGVYNPNERLYDFVIDVNPQSLPLNGGEDMEISDTHTDNLSVQYQSVKAYKVTGVVTKDAFKTAIQNYLKTHEDATGFTMDGIAPATEISWNFTGNIGTFSGIKDRTHYLIYYSSLITGSNQQNFSNEAEMEGFIDTQSSSKTYGSSGSGAATIYQIGLLKYKDGKTSEGLQGVKFQLFRGDNKEPMTYGDTAYTQQHNLVGKNITFTTGADGYVRIALNQTEHGAELEEDVQYWLKEIESPAGYQIDSSVEYWKFKLTTDPDEVNYGEGGEYIYFYYDDIMKMSNTPTNEPLTVQVDKLWLGLDGEAMTDVQKQNLTATVQLYKKTNAGEYEAVEGKISGQTGEEYDGQVILNKDNNWTYTWNNLPRVDGQGNKYAYKLEEIAGPNTEDIYASSVALSEDETNKHYVITNQKVEQRDVDVSVRKTWLDREGDPLAVEYLPEYIRFYLYRVVSKVPFKVAPTSGGNPYDAGPTYNSYLVPAPDGNTGLYQLTKSNSNNYTSGLTFANLPSIVVNQTNNDATFYAYYVKEVPVDGYAPSAVVTTTTDTTGNTTKYKTTVALTNRKLPEPIDLTVRKAWKDDTGADMASIPNHTVVFHLYQVASSTPFDADPSTWPTSGGALYDYDYGGYSNHIVYENSVRVTGTYQFDLYNGDNGTGYTAIFNDLPANSVDAKGKVTYYAYYVDEVEIEGYDARYATTRDSETGAYTITMTNQQTPKYTSITADKTWLDKDGGPNLLAEKTDADEVTLDVYRVNGEGLPVGTAVVDGVEYAASDIKTLTVTETANANTNSVQGKVGDTIVVKVTHTGGNTINPTLRYTKTTDDNWNYNIGKNDSLSTSETVVFKFNLAADMKRIKIDDGSGGQYNVEFTNSTSRSIQYKMTQAQAAGISGAVPAGTLKLNKSNGWTDSINNLLAESQGTKYTYFVVERGGSEYQAEYVYDGNTVHVTNREKDMLEVDKKWLNAVGDDYTNSKKDGTVTYTLYQSATAIPIPTTVTVDYSSLKWGHEWWGIYDIDKNNGTGSASFDTIPSINVGSDLTIIVKENPVESSNNASLDGLLINGQSVSSTFFENNEGYRTRKYVIKNVPAQLVLTGTIQSNPWRRLSISIIVDRQAEAQQQIDSGDGTPIPLGTITVGYDSIKSTTLSSPCTVAAGKTPWSALIGNLPTTDGTNNFTYYVEETEVTGFDKSGDGAANVVEAGGKITVTNQKQPTGSLRVKKELAGLTYDDLTDAQKQALSKISFTVKNAGEETVATVTLGHALEGKTIGDLAPGTYTVTETRPNDSTPSGYLYKKTTVKVNNGAPVETVTASATVSANTVTNVTYVNEYGPATADLTVTKRIDKANSATENVTFYVGLFANATDTTPIAAGEVGGMNPQPITFTAGSTDTSKTATFTGLTVGTTYYVFETDSTGRKVTTADKTNGYAIVAADVEGKSVSIQPGGSTAFITNTYSATGSVPFKAKKTLEGGDLTADQFSFTLVEYTDNTFQTVKDGGVSQSKGNAIGGDIAFDEVALADTATRYFKIKETVPTGQDADGSIIYDTHETNVTVTVTDDGKGNLVYAKNPSAVEDYDASFKNTKKGALTITKAVTVDGSAEKAVSTKLADGTYSFTITGPNSYSHTGEITVTNGAAQNNISLTDLTPGEYIVTEATPTNGTAISKINAAASSVYNTTVTVQPNQTETVAYTNDIETAKLTVEKKWLLNGTPATEPKQFDGSVISAIEFNLFQKKKGDVDGTQYGGTYTISSDNGWKIEIDVPKYVWDDTQQKNVLVSYYLQETTALDHYNTTITSNSVTVSKSDPLSVVDSDKDVTITNSLYTVALPSTGGVGTGVVYGAGAALILLALLGLVLMNRKRSRGTGI